MDKKGLDRRAELTSIQIILIILAIMGFAIVLAALFLVDLGGYSEGDICRLSVLTRATTPSSGQALVPLKCRTKKICIREGFLGDACKDRFAGEEDVEYVRLSGSVPEKREKIEEIMSNAMFDCWNMMGQGKLDLFGDVSTTFGFDPVKSSCVVCSRVAVDKSVSNETLYKNRRAADGSVIYEKDSSGRRIPAIDTREYMENHQIPGQSLTYLQTFTDRGVNSYSKIDTTKPVAEEKEIGRPAQVNNEMAFVFMQIKTNSVPDVLQNQLYAGGALAGAVFTSGAGKIISLVGAKFVIAATAVVAVGTGTIGVVNALEGQKVAGVHCGKFTSNKKEANKGCSIVQGMDYRFDVINNLCGTIEGEL